MKRRSKLNTLILTLGLLLILIPTKSFAFTEYYVDFANGTDGARGCTDAAGDECKTLQYAADNVTSQAGGSRINVEYDDASMTQTLGATVDFDTNNGTDTQPIVVQGYSATVGDGTKAIIDGNSAAANCIDNTRDFIIFRDLELKGSTAAAFYTDGAAAFVTIYDVKVTTAGDQGIATASGNSITVLSSEITGTTQHGMEFFGSARVVYNYIHDTSGPGLRIAGQTSQTIYKNIIDTTNGSNITIDTDWVMVLDNTLFDANGAGSDNVSVTSDDAHIIINNIMNDAVDENYDNDSVVYIDGFNNTNTNGGTAKSGTTMFYLGGDDVSDPGFTNTATADFNIDGTLDDAGFPQTFIGASNTTGNIEMGVAPYEETAGGGTNANGAVSVGF